MVGAAYLLGLYQTLSRWPFLCFHDDFVVLFRSQAEMAECLLLVWLRLDQIGLELNKTSISSGRVHQEGFSFMGYEYKGENFVIQPEKEKDFRHQVIRLTTFLRPYKNQKAFIKQLNRKIMVFGNYYKHGLNLESFIRLDKLIRKRVRQYLFLVSDLKDRTDNLPKDSDTLYAELGLCSLVHLNQVKETKKSGSISTSARMNTELDFGTLPVCNKAKVAKLLQQMLVRYSEQQRQQNVVIELLEHLAPLSNEISAQPGVMLGIF
jgi:hypothetical protein